MQQLTQKDIACVIGLYHKTHSRKQVARELGLSEYRVRRILIDNGILGDYDATIAAAIAPTSNKLIAFFFIFPLPFFLFGNFVDLCPDVYI